MPYHAHSVIDWRFNRDRRVPKPLSEQDRLKAEELAARVEDAQRSEDLGELVALRYKIFSSGLDCAAQESLEQARSEYLEQIFNAMILQMSTMRDLEPLRGQIKRCGLPLAAEERLRVAANNRVGQVWWKQLVG